MRLLVLMYGRHQNNIVKQLSFKWKKKQKTKTPLPEGKLVKAALIDRDESRQTCAATVFNGLKGVSKL